MKYIRTKDGIYEVDSESRHLTFINSEKLLVNNSSILAQANTIEELCDELVVKHINNEKPYVADNYQKHDLLKDRQKVFEYGVEIVYGAIYTNKGLIYVGKMNENGGFELI